MSKARHNIVPYNKLDLSKVTITDKDGNVNQLEDNDRIPSQKIAYFRYNDEKKGEAQWDIQTCEILLDNFGIPDSEGPYYQTAKARAFVKVPLGVNDQVTTESEEERGVRKKKLLTFKKTLEEIDEYLGSEEMKTKIFGKNAKKMQYQPIVRQSIVRQDDDSDEDEDDKEVVARPDYMKAKIQLEYNTDNVQVEVFQKNNEGSEAYNRDGSHSEINVSDLDELRKHVAYMRKQRMVLHVAKFWAAKQVQNGQDKKMYGATLKLRRVEVQERVMQSQAEEDNDKDAEPFIDSDDDEEVETKLVKEVTTKEVAADSDEDDDSDEDEDTPPPAPKKTGRKKTATK
jgi:hypothetical protein